MITIVGVILRKPPTRATPLRGGPLIVQKLSGGAFQARMGQGTRSFYSLQTVNLLL